MAENKQLAPVNEFHVASLMDGWTEEQKAEYLDQLSDFEGGGGIDYRNITVQAGGNIFFKITGETPEDQDQQKEIKAVIIYAHNTNNYWSMQYGESDDDNAKKPDCSSLDGKTGWNRMQSRTCSCADCPQNKFGSDRNGRGKACRNSKNLYLMRPSDPSLYRLSVPATSLAVVNRQISKIMAAHGSYTGIVLSFTLKPMEKNGNAFSIIQINAVGSLSAQDARNAAEMRRRVKAQHEADKSNLGSYEITEAAGDGDELPIDNVPQSGYADPAQFADLGGSDVPWPDEAPPARTSAAANTAAQTQTARKKPSFTPAQQAIDVQYEEAPSL